jgi:AraC family transcriptional regulator
VTIVDFPETRVAALEHRGDPRRLGDSLRAFIEWRKQNRLPPRVSATFNLLYDDPATTAPEAFRLDLCAATERSVAANPFGVIGKTIPGGRCARLRHVGSDDTLGEAVRYLYATWLPGSGEEPRDVPLFVQRVRFFPDVPEAEAVSDVYLPLR